MCNSEKLKMVTGTTSGNSVQQGASNPVVNSTMGSHPEQKKVASDNRRSNKPIMEKRRRARINNCLNELKALILDAMKKDPARHSKLEKADILEMTVKHLEGLRSEPNSGGSPDRFRAGYRRCAAEVARFPGVETTIRKRLLRHLDNCVGSSTETSVPTRPASVPTPPSDIEDATSQLPSQSTIFISAGPGSGVRLVPTRLSNGDLALVVPAGIAGTVSPLAKLPPRAGSASSASSEGPCSPNSSGWSSPPPQLALEQPAPLALVTRRNQSSEDRPCWRPW